MKAKFPKITCRTCNGTGTVDITPAQFDTLQIVKKLGKATSYDVWKHPDFKDHMVISGMSNRLEMLYEFGLLDRIRDGRGWLYWVKK